MATDDNQLQYYRRQFAAQSAWPQTEETRLASGGYLVERAYALTLNVEQVYDDSARLFADYRRDDPEGGTQAEHIFQVLMLFLHLVAQAYARIQIGTDEDDDAPAVGGGGNAANADDNNGLFVDDLQRQIEQTYRQLQIDLDPETAAALAEMRQTAVAAAGGVSTPAAHARPVDIRAENDRTGNTEGDGTPAVRSKRPRMLIILEEVPYEGDRATGEGQFAEYHNMRRKRPAAAYTIHVLTVGVDLNRQLTAVLAQNYIQSISSCASTVVLTSKERLRAFGITDRNDEEEQPEDDAPGANIWPDDEAEEAEEGDGDGQGRRRRGGRRRRSAPKRKKFEGLVPRLDKRRRAVDRQVWETFRNISLSMLPLLHGYMVNNRMAQMFFRERSVTDGELTLDNPCHPANWFSIATALMCRPIDCDARQGLIAYARAHDRREQEHDAPYVAMGSPFARTDMVVWRAPTGLEGRFRVLQRLEHAQPAIFAHKCLPHAQSLGQLWAQLWPGIFPMDKHMSMPELWVSVHNVAQHGTIGPVVREPRIAGRMLSITRLQDVLTLAREFQTNARVREQILDVRTKLDRCRRLSHRRRVLRLNESLHSQNSQLGASFDHNSSSSSSGSVDNQHAQGMLVTAGVPLMDSGSSTTGYLVDTNQALADFGLDDLGYQADLQSDNAMGFAYSEDSMDVVQPVPAPRVPLAQRAHTWAAGQSQHHSSTSSVDLDRLVARMTDADFVSNAQEIERLEDRLSNLELLCSAPTVRQELMQEDQRLQQATRTREAWQRAYLSITRNMNGDARHTTGADDVAEREHAANRMEMQPDGTVRTAEDAQLQSFDSGALVYGNTSVDFLQMIQGKRQSERMGLTINQLCDSNEPVLRRLRELLRINSNTMSAVQKRAAMIAFEQSVLNQHHRLTSCHSADLAKALQVVYECAHNERLCVWGPWRRRQKIDASMPTISNILASHMEEYNVLLMCAVPKTTLMAWISGLTATHYIHSLKPNILLAGGPGVSKTFALMLLRLLRCHIGLKNQKKSTMEVTRVTEHSTSVDMGALNNHVVQIFNEMSRELMVCELEGGMGSPTWKQLLDSLVSYVYSNVRDKDSGVFKSQERFCEWINVVLAAINWPLFDMPPPMASRFLCIQCHDAKGSNGSVSGAMEREMQQHEVDHEKAQELYHFHHFLHYMQTRVDMLIKEKEMNDVGEWLVGIVISHINRHLGKQNMRPLAPRIIKFIHSYARTLCIQEVCQREFCYAGGMFETHDVTDERICLLRPYLYIAMRHLVPAIGMIAPCAFPQGEDDVRRGIRLMLGGAAKGDRGIDGLFRSMVSPQQQQHPAQEQHEPNRQAEVAASPMIPQDRTRIPTNREMLSNGFEQVAEENAQEPPGSNNHVRAQDGSVYRPMVDPVPQYSTRQYVPDYRFVSLKRNERFKNPFMQVGSTICSFMKSCPEVKKKYSPDMVALVLFNLSQETLQTPRYHRPPNADLPVPVPDSETSLVNIVSVDDYRISISYHWLCQEGECSLDVVLSALKELCNHRHQPHMRTVWTPSDDVANVFDVVDLGNEDCDDDALPLLLQDNACFMTEKEILTVYAPGEIPSHMWKTQQGMRIDMPLDVCAARLHGESYMGHPHPTTEADVVQVLYTGEHVFHCSDTTSRYHGDRGRFTAADFADFDHIEDLDMPEYCFMVPNPLQPSEPMHHADMLFGEDAAQPSERRAMYKQNNYFTLQQVVEDRVDHAEYCAGHTTVKYPQVFRERHERQQEMQRTRNPENYTSLHESMTQASTVDDQEREEIKAREQGMQAALKRIQARQRVSVSTRV